MPRVGTRRFLGGGGAEFAAPHNTELFLQVEIATNLTYYLPIYTNTYKERLVKVSTWVLSHGDTVG